MGQKWFFVCQLHPGLLSNFFLTNCCTIVHSHNINLCSRYELFLQKKDACRNPNSVHIRFTPPPEQEQKSPSIWKLTQNSSRAMFVKCKKRLNDMWCSETEAKRNHYQVLEALQDYTLFLPELLAAACPSYVTSCNVSEHVLLQNSRYETFINHWLLACSVLLKIHTASFFFFAQFPPLGNWVGHFS